MTEVYYHIGLMKTGSTFLQTRVFPFLDKATYMGNGINGHRRYMSLKQHNKVVVSNETTPGVWFKDAESELTYYHRFKTGVNNIKNLFSNVKIIVVFREPSSFLHSSYKQYLHQGGVLEWEDFTNKYIQNHDIFCFSKYIKFLLNNFNKDDVLLLKFDDLKSNNLQFSKKVLDFIGEHERVLSKSERFNKRSNKAIPDAYEKYLIWLNRNKKLTSLVEKTILNFKYNGSKVKLQFIPRYVLPKILGNGKKRNLDELKEYYKEDWAYCCSLIDESQK